MIPALEGEAHISPVDAGDSGEWSDNQNQSEASSYESEESKLKSQNEGWNLGGHPRLP